mmetsp:Transcript_32280/g.31572  ORF Transcript_32280/g.31572 Transcript_32280/m.31572 type:complete len:109 (-) Transcript_32280:1250-1576(-)
MKSKTSVKFSLNFAHKVAGFSPYKVGVADATALDVLAAGISQGDLVFVQLYVDFLLEEEVQTVDPIEIQIIAVHLFVKRSYRDYRDVHFILILDNRLGGAGFIALFIF